MAPKRKATEAATEKSKPASKTKAAPAAKKAKKTVEMTTEEFLENAKDIEVSFGEHGKAVAKPKEFSTGSFGWHATSKIKVMVEIDGEEKEVATNVSLNITAAGSKPAAKSKAAKAAPKAKANGKKAASKKKVESEEEDNDDDNEEDEEE